MDLEEVGVEETGEGTGLAAGVQVEVVEVG